MLLIMMVTEMMMKMMANTQSMNIRVFKGSFCENVLQVLYMTLPKPKFRDSADQFRLAGTMESDPLEARNETS